MDVRKERALLTVILARRDEFASTFAALPIVKKNLLTYEQVREAGTVKP